ncbi:MAG: tetratricopeptide repeat protein, partial [Geopsychrobacter sp.]|nr:tetratricopeptide repeat protein [Geopsychrobacter sp.]
MRLLLLLIIGVFFIQTLPASAYQRGVLKKNEAAIELLKQQQYAAALVLLHQAAAEVPFNQVIQKNIATAYLGAGQQQIHAGDYAQAAELLQQGKEYNDQESRLWLLRGIAFLKNGNLIEAEAELNEAWAMRGDEPRVLQFLGQVYYETDRMFEAVDIWQRALELDSRNKSLSALLEKARREFKVEKELERNYSAHFILSYAENRKADIGGDILDALEAAYTWAGAKLGHYPERQTPVILYTQRQFSGLTGSPEWAAGLYDGKIRLSIGGLTLVTPRVKSLLAHELMHVMVRDIASNRVPFWLNEVFQWHDLPGHSILFQLPIFFLIAVIIAFIQWRRVRHRPADRAADRWFSMSLFVCDGLALLVYYLPMTLKGSHEVPLAVGLGIMLLLYLGLAMGVLRYRLFNLDRWWFDVWLWFLAGVVLVSFDVGLVFLASLSQPIALTISLLLVGWCYFPLRIWVWNRIYRPSRRPVAEVLPMLISTLLENPQSASSAMAKGLRG